MFSLMWNYGRHYWVNAEETKSLVNSEGAVEMFKAFQDMQFKDQSLPWTGNPYRTEYGFNQGAAAMTIQYISTASYTLAQTFERQGTSFDWRLGTFPKGPRDQQHFSQGHIWSVAKGQRQPERGWAMAEWLGSMEAEKVWAETGRTPPQVPSAELWELYFSKWPAETRKAAIDFILNTVYKGQGGQLPVLADLLRVPAHHDGRTERHLRRQAGAPQGGYGRAARQIDEVLRTAPR